MSRQRKRTWFILWFAFTFSVVIYGLLVHLLTAQPDRLRPPDPTTMRPVFYGIAGLGLCAAIALSFLKMPAAATLQKFQTMMILALGLSELCCITGLVLFFLGAPAGEFLRFQVATILVNVLFILPQVIRRPG